MRHRHTVRTQGRQVRQVPDLRSIEGHGAPDVAQHAEYARSSEGYGAPDGAQHGTARQLGRPTRVRNKRAVTNPIV